MPKTIQQTILFRNTGAGQLYELYMDSKKHALVTGAPAAISPKEGGSYRAHDGYITGTNLQLVRDRLIVQSWKASDWDRKAIDSTFIIYIEPKGNDTLLQMIHVNVPDEHYESISKGWKDYYWKRWKKYLSGKPPGERLSM